MMVTLNFYVEKVSLKEDYKQDEISRKWRTVLIRDDGDMKVTFESNTKFLCRSGQFIELQISTKPQEVDKTLVEDD